MPVSKIRKYSHAGAIKSPRHPCSKRHSLYLFVCVAAAILNRDAWGLTNGTYIAISIDPNYFIGAADSRFLSQNDIPEDFCKIRILGGNVVFLQIGYFVRPDNSVDQAYNISRGNTLESLADAWADTIIPRFSDIPMSERAQMFEHYPRHEVTTGLFGGTDDLGRVYARGITIVFNDITQARIGFRKDPFAITPITGQQIQGTGSHPDLYAEFFSNATERAREANHAVDKIRGVSFVERIALRARALVKFMIDYADDPTIGGLAYAAILERGKNARWLTPKPDFCSEN